MLLYELLTGETPFARRLRGAPLLEVLRALREEEPPAPSARLKAAAEQAEVAARRGAGPDKLVKQVRGELDWVVLKALEKDRSRRYETAAALAEDVRRYLNDEPVQAGPPSRAYRLKKFLRRHRGGVLAGANSYSSFTRVLEGTLNIRHPSALGTAAGTGDQTNVFPGAILELQGGITVAAEILALTAPNVGETIVRSVSGNNTWAGSISLERPATFDVASASELTISGVISGGLSSTLTKDGTGRLILSAANTYSGQTVVGLGFLNIRNGSALGSTQNGTLVTDGVLELESATGIAVGAEALSSDGAALGFDVVRNKSGNNSWAGPIDLGPDTTTFRVDDTSQLTLRGIVSGGADEDLLKRGTGTLVLTEANTYQGTTTIFEGILTIRDAEALGSSVGDTRVQGTGAALGIDGDFDVVGEALRLNGSGVQGLGGLFKEGQRVIASTTNWTGSVLLTGSATIRTDARTTLVLSGVVSSVATSVPLTKEGTGVLTFGGGASNTFGGLVTVNDGRLDLAKTGVDQAFQGNLTINGGEVRYLAGGQLPGDTVVTVNSAGLFNLNGFSDIIDELNVNGGNVRTGSGGLTVSDKITSNNTAGTPSLIEALGSLSLTAASTRTITVIDGPAEVDLAFTGFFAGSALIKEGAGRLEVRTPFGEPGFQVNAGVVRFVNVGGALGSIGSVSVANGAAVELGGGLVLPPSFGPTINGNGVGGAGALRSLDGNNSLSQISLGSSSRVAVDAGQLTASSVSNTAATPTNLNKIGAGTLIVNTTAFRTGSAVNLDDGTLLVNGAASVATGFAPVPVNVNAAATLGGSGTVGTVTVNNSGTLSPGGTSPGILTVNGDVVFNASTNTLRIDLNGTTPGSGHDQVNVPTASDLVVLNGANLSVNLGFASAVGNTYTIINNAGTDVVSGQFAQGNSISVPGPNGNITFDILYNVGNNDVVLRHANTGSAFRNRAVTPVVTEGGFATLTGTIVEPDPLDTFVLVVNWGDGSGTETHVYPPGSPRDLALRHRYLDNRPGELSSRYTIDLSWHDQHGVGNSGVLDVTVLNANPQVFAGRDVILRDGKQLSRTGFVTDAGVLDTWTATVDYGDGSGLQALSLRREGSFTLRHRYDRPGVYQVTVTVTDDDGGVGRATFLVSVERDAGGRNIRAAQSGVPADSVITLLNGGEDKTEFPNPFRPGRRRLQ